MHPYEQYRTTQILSANQGELVVLLYEGALKFLVRAEAELHAGRLEPAHNNLVRAQDIIVELLASLNQEAGNITDSLRDVYLYMHRRLAEANVRKDAKVVTEVVSLLRTLLSAWQEASKAAIRSQTTSLSIRAMGDTSV